MVAVQVGIMLTVLIGFAALAVDVGAIYNAKGELQRTADAAATAAASLLGEASDPLGQATAEACKYAANNYLFGQPLALDPNTDIVFGQAQYDPVANQYTFIPTTYLPDAVKVTVRLSTNSPNGALPLYFAAIFGKSYTDVSAEAIAVVVPRDIAITADLSGSMNDDSELKNVHNHPVNLFDIWAALPLNKGKPGTINGYNPAAPASTPAAGDNQPATGPGLPGHIGGNPNPNNEAFSDGDPHGPRWGWMTTWGTTLTPNVYDPVTDTGLYYVPKGSSTTAAEITNNLTESGYSSTERSALMSSANDSTTTYYRNRTKVLLGLAGWRSGKSGGKYPTGAGDGDNVVESSELVQTVAYPFSGGSWDDYIDYVRGTSGMTSGDSDFRYRFGIKTFVNYLLENRESHAETPELAGTPEQPMQAVKDAVNYLSEMLHNLNSLDQMSLEIYATNAVHEQDLSLLDGSADYYAANAALKGMQAGHYNSYTNIGGGIAQAIDQLTQSGNQQQASRKVLILLTDGVANIDQYGNNNVASAKAYALAQAQAAANAGIRIYAVSNGYGADTDFMDQIAEIGGGTHFHAEGTIDEYSDELEAIFFTIGGMRPIELIK